MATRLSRFSLTSHVLSHINHAPLSYKDVPHDLGAVWADDNNEIFFDVRHDSSEELKKSVSRFVCLTLTRSLGLSLDLSLGLARSHSVSHSVSY